MEKAPRNIKRLTVRGLMFATLLVAVYMAGWYSHDIHAIRQSELRQEAKYRELVRSIRQQFGSPASIRNGQTTGKPVSIQRDNPNVSQGATEIGLE